MTLKSMLIENLKDYSREMFLKELNKYSVSEQKDILKLKEDIKENLKIETTKGNNVFVAQFDKDEEKYVQVISMWLESEILYWEIDEDKKQIIIMICE